MPRRERFNLVGYPQHVIQRGNNRQDCFINDEDRVFYIECLLEASQKQGAKVHSYAHAPFTFIAQIRMILIRHRPLGTQTPWHSLLITKGFLRSKKQ